MSINESSPPKSPVVAPHNYWTTSPSKKIEPWLRYEFEDVTVQELELPRHHLALVRKGPISNA